MARRFLAHCFALAALGVCVPALHAQDHLLDDLYGRGVHAYFSRNYQDAYKHLSDAVTSGSTDPRVYYFRALADHRLNKPEDVAADLKKAAELEFNGDQPVQVSKALERIQGPERLMIEDVRSKARISIRNTSEERAKLRYENRIKAEAGVLRKPPVGGAATPPPPAPGPAAPDKTDPFGGAPETPATPPAAAPARPAAEDPFGGDAPAKPAADDPFGDAPAKPAAPSAEKPAPPAAEQPAEAPSEVKPASATEPAAPGKGSILGSFARAFSKAVPGEAKVAASKPPVAEEPPPPKVDPNTPDPFGDASAKPAAAKTAPAPPAAAPAAADPFADDPPAKPAGKAPAKPAAKAADDDPFK